jgi:hypothetical protein
MGSASFDLDYWLACADRARADGIREPRTRLTMLRVAKGYERLAQHAQERASRLAAVPRMPLPAEDICTR